MPETSTAEQLLELARPLGLTESTLELLRLLPVVYVAWADGELQPEELDIILASADQLGVIDGESLGVLQGWLGERPDETFFREGLRVLGYLVASLPEDEAEQAVADVTALSDAVARAAGGIRGHQVRVDASEQLALRRIAQRLRLAGQQSGRAALREILEFARRR